MNFKLIIFIVILGITKAWWFSSNKCPEVRSKSDFQMEKFLGKWYEVKYSYTWWKIGVKCVTITFQLSENNSTFSFVLNETRWRGLTTTINGTISFDSNSEDAKFTSNFQFGNIYMKLTYWLIETDYDNYAVLWSCSTGYISKQQNVWIFSREKGISADNLKKAYQSLRDNKISVSHLQSSDLSGCPEDN